MILVDQRRAYVGSVNFSNNSTQRARELGIVFTDDLLTKIIVDEFEKDWLVSKATKSLNPGFCPSID